MSQEQVQAVVYRHMVCDLRCDPIAGGDDSVRSPLCAQVCEPTTQQRREEGHYCVMLHVARRPNGAIDDERVPSG